MRRRLAVALVTALLAIVTAGVLFACSQSPTSVPVRTFERAQRMDVVCMRLFDPPGPGRPLNEFVARDTPVGRPESDCAPVPSDLEGASFDRQLFAVVTQTQRGELAVVDLTAGRLVDQKLAQPGINFIPVGANPTGVASTPDGKMVFVASAETNKPAIYGIPTRRLVGDTPGFNKRETPTLGSWPVCSLPQNPGSISVVPRRNPAGTPPAKDANGDTLPLYDIVVVLPGDRLGSAKVLTLDPRAFRRGGLPTNPDGTPDYTKDISAGDGETATIDGNERSPVLRPGALAPCTDFVESAIELVGGETMPATFAPGSTWDDGVKYVDGGVDTTCLSPRREATCANAPCCDPVQILPVPEAGVGGGTYEEVATEAGVDAGTCTPVGGADAGALPFSVGPVDPPRLVSFARYEQYAFIADAGAPLVHVLDLSDPAAPRELPPYLATSLAQPSRLVRVKDVAVSPPTRDYKRFLYAIDDTDGSLMVFDVTDPLTAARTPMQRPHPELNPFQPIDRIADFGAPVVAVSFARNDVPLAQLDGVSIPSAASGLLCNPNPALERVNGGNPRDDLGYYYRADVSDPGQTIGPRRLRGIFAFATLSSGSVAVVDVDDWDSPCRRPQDMSFASSSIAPAQPGGDATAYHAPKAGLGTTGEGFFPMTPPHGIRSSKLVLADEVAGNQLPRYIALPTITSNGVTLSQTGIGSENTPVISPPIMSFENAQVHRDQDWAFTYEGIIPGFDGVSATIDTTNNYASLVLGANQAHFCSRGIEDWARGIDRVRALNAELARRPGNPSLGVTERQMTDYIQLNEDLLPASDDYWNVNQECWEGTLATASGPTRHDFCDGVYGQTASDEKPSRDFPIVEAYDDRLVIGRFYTPAGREREVVYTDPSNSADLKLMQCCFHRRAKFNVRTAKQWSAVGYAPGTVTPGVGFLSHLSTDSAGRCVSSCDPKDVLLNGRMPTIPNGIPLASLERNTPLRMRNPFFQVGIFAAPSGLPPVRDMRYAVPIRGGFTPLLVNIGSSSVSVSPQSMRFIDSLGQIAVVDGASQGLVLIDLQAVAVARAPYF